MILTTIEQLQSYSSMNPYFPAAFAAMAELAGKDFQPGTYPVDGDNVFIKAVTYDTHSVRDALMEAHRAYIDVMWMVSGREEISVCPASELTAITQPYDAGGDAVLAGMAPECSALQMKAGSVCILFPEDGHAPGLDAGGKAQVQKLIAKVRVV